MTNKKKFHEDRPSDSRDTKSPDSAPMHSDATSAARRRLLQAAGGSALAGAALSVGWQRPVVESVILPAHAQTTTSLVRFSYDNSAPLNPAVPAGSVHSSTSPCGGLSGPAALSGGLYVNIPCRNQGSQPTALYRITTWIIDGNNVVSGAGPTFEGGASGPPSFAKCVTLLGNMAAAMNSLDPDGDWEFAVHSLPSSEGCGEYVLGRPRSPDSVDYGAMVIVDEVNTGQQWIATPGVRPA